MQENISGCFSSSEHSILVARVWKMATLEHFSSIISDTLYYFTYRYSFPS